MFDENLSYDHDMNLAVKFCVEVLSIFWSMYILQQKGKENLERTEQLQEILESQTRNKEMKLIKEISS